ncbi:cell division protein CdvB3 [Sulfolobus tengchongensis]|uniref:Cell division protein CdvB3 n=1 Tax=Sulfolobus tengchongensis TaxID=207809 RepID=A0AAX4KZZ7_9CREN
MKKRGKTLAELLIDVRILRNKVQHVIVRMRNRLETYNDVVIRDISSFPHLSKMVAQESEVLEGVLERLLTLEVMLEILEIKIETIIYIGNIVTSAVSVVEAIKLLKENFNFMPEISVSLDEIYNNFYINVDLPKEIKINAKEEARNILADAEKIAEKRRDQVYNQGISSTI